MLDCTSLEYEGFEWNTRCHRNNNIKKYAAQIVLRAASGSLYMYIYVRETKQTASCLCTATFSYIDTVCWIKTRGGCGYACIQLPAGYTQRFWARGNLATRLSRTIELLLEFWSSKKYYIWKKIKFQERFSLRESVICMRKMLYTSSESFLCRKFRRCRAFHQCMWAIPRSAHTSGTVL